MSGGVVLNLFHICTVTYSINREDEMAELVQIDFWYLDDKFGLNEFRVQKSLQEFMIIATKEFCNEKQSGSA